MMTANCLSIFTR